MLEVSTLADGKSSICLSSRSCLSIYPGSDSRLSIRAWSASVRKYGTFSYTMSVMPSIFSIATSFMMLLM